MRLAKDEGDDRKLAKKLKKFAGTLSQESANQDISNLINLTIGMNIDNNGTAMDTYGSESCGAGYGY